MLTTIRPLVLAMVLLCGATILASCSKDDDLTNQLDEYTGVSLIILEPDNNSSAEEHRRHADECLFLSRFLQKSVTK